MSDLLRFARDKQAEKTRILNDNFRTTFLGGRVVMSAAVAELPLDVKASAILATQRFSHFDGANDPYGEHDFGAFELADLTFFWKIDYYNVDMTGGSENPADPEETTRVLTLMLNTDY